MSKFYKTIDEIIEIGYEKLRRIDALYKGHTEVRILIDETNTASISHRDKSDVSNDEAMDIFCEFYPSVSNITFGKGPSPKNNVFYMTNDSAIVRVLSNCCGLHK